MSIVDGCNATSFVPLLGASWERCNIIPSYSKKKIIEVCFFFLFLPKKNNLQVKELFTLMHPCRDSIKRADSKCSWTSIHKRINVGGSKALWVNDVVFTERKLTSDSYNLLHMLVTEPWSIIIPALFYPLCDHSALKKPTHHINLL